MASKWSFAMAVDERQAIFNLRLPDAVIGDIQVDNQTGAVCIPLLHLLLTTGRNPSWRLLGARNPVCDRIDNSALPSPVLIAAPSFRIVHLDSLEALVDYPGFKFKVRPPISFGYEPYLACPTFDSELGRGQRIA